MTRPEQSGQFATQEAALADAFSYMQPGEQVVIHEDTCATMDDQPCNCQPEQYEMTEQRTLEPIGSMEGNA